jgi:nucleoside-diphosphate-sugar epimerase
MTITLYTPSVLVWGRGKPRREFLCVDDMADACCFLMQHYNDGEIINIGTGIDITIAELAAMMAEITGLPVKLFMIQLNLMERRLSALMSVK